ncbi:hypothetical protein N3K66_008344 [Trichothecium roseum]|uniref:Uncharacterized protein n=1 Tax=Trichothecium roseum TaxID=47278 RepID=A0ACC0URM6_9HYPO|nr:hypothetical protein N3K66_008344 [Trichothecium roseum]
MVLTRRRKGTYKEPFELTEAEWDAVFTNNRALHGWSYVNGLPVKARKQAFQVKPNPDARPKQALPIPKQDLPVVDGAANNEPSVRARPLPPIPPFYVWDNATVEVTEMTSAMEATVANQGFSSTVIKGAGGLNIYNTEAAVSGVRDEQDSTAEKTVTADKVNSIHVAYKFPRVAVEVDQYCLELTEECKKQALACQDVHDVDRWKRDYGYVFATQFTLGGELTSTRLFHGGDTAKLSAVKDSLKIAAGVSISAPYASASVDYGSMKATEGTTGDRAAQQSMRLAWQAKGGDTLLCSNPPRWAGTVKDHRLWRIMDQQGLVYMQSLVNSVDSTAYRFLENPETATKDRVNTRGNTKLREKITLDLRDVLNAAGNPLADQIKAFYGSEDFTLDEYNESLPPNQKSARLKEFATWSSLDILTKCYIAMLGYEKKLYTLP